MNINDHLRAVVFDLDGTLFDTLPSLVAAAAAVLVPAGLAPVALSALRPALSQGLPALFDQALRLQAEPVAPARARQLAADWTALYTRQWLTCAPLFEQAGETLALLRAQGLRLAICTNRDQASSAALLQGAAIAGLFDVLVGIDEGLPPKPAPAPLLHALQRLDVPAAQALFVGDSGIDAACAQAAGVRFAAHLGGYAGHAGELQPQAFGFSAFPELGAWVGARPGMHQESRHV